MFAPFDPLARAEQSVGVVCQSLSFVMRSISWSFFSLLCITGGPNPTNYISQAPLPTWLPARSIQWEALVRDWKVEGRKKPGCFFPSVCFRQHLHRCGYISSMVPAPTSRPSLYGPGVSLAAGIPRWFSMLSSLLWTTWQVSHTVRPYGERCPASPRCCHQP